MVRLIKSKSYHLNTCLCIYSGELNPGKYQNGILWVVTPINLLMFKVKKIDIHNKKYSKTQPDEPMPSELTCNREEQAKDRLHELSYFTKEIISSNHHTCWVNHTDTSDNEHQTLRAGKEGCFDQTLHSIKKNTVLLKKKDILMRKKKHDREGQLKCSIANAFKNSKMKNACTSLNFSLPMQPQRQRQRIHSHSVRDNTSNEKRNGQYVDFQQTNSLFRPFGNSTQRIRSKTQSSASLKNKKSQSRLQTTMVSRKRIPIFSCLDIQPDRQGFKYEKPHNKFLSILTSLITVQKQKVYCPLSVYRCPRKFRGSLRKERLSLG